MDGKFLSEDPEQRTAAIIDVCHTAHRRLVAAISGLPDEAVTRPSRLPGWTVGHVLTSDASKARFAGRRSHVMREGRRSVTKRSRPAHSARDPIW